MNPVSELAKKIRARKEMVDNFPKFYQKLIKKYLLSAKLPENIINLLYAIAYSKHVAYQDLYPIIIAEGDVQNRNVIVRGININFTPRKYINALITLGGEIKALEEDTAPMLGTLPILRDYTKN